MCPLCLLVTPSAPEKRRRQLLMILQLQDQHIFSWIISIVCESSCSECLWVYTCDDMSWNNMLGIIAFKSQGTVFSIGIFYLNGNFTILSSNWTWGPGIELRTRTLVDDPLSPWANWCGRWIYWNRNRNHHMKTLIHRDTRVKSCALFL